MKKAVAIISTTLLVLVTPSVARADQIHYRTWKMMTLAHSNTVSAGTMDDSCYMWSDEPERFTEIMRKRIYRNVGLLFDDHHPFYGDRVTIHRYMDSVC